LGFAAYARLVRVPAIRQILVLTLLSRTPLWAGNVVVTLHVVSHLGRSYAAAGLVSAVQAVMLCLSGPFRGRRLDRLGLRRAVAPSLAVLTCCWVVAPWVGFWPFLVLVALAGLFTVPTFAITRSVLINNTSLEHRTAALSLDGILSDITFMVGPVLGVVLATSVPTPVALFACQMGSVCAVAAIWWANPAISPPDRDSADASSGTTRAGHAWLNAGTVAVLAVAAVATFILVAEDLATIAAARHWHVPQAAGWLLALWGAGSLLGGIVYGALHRHPRAATVLAWLAASTVLVAVANDRLVFAALLTVSGALSAPTITSTADELSRLVPPRNRTEAMGWHGSATTLGGAVGAPVAGMAIDQVGWQGGFVAVGAIGLVIAAAGMALRRTRATTEHPVAAMTSVPPSSGAPDAWSDPAGD
jgi:MFS family permease